MKKMSVFCFIVWLVLCVNCNRSGPMLDERDESPVFPYPGSSSDPMTVTSPTVNSHLVAVSSDELPDSPAGLTNTYLCLWTSGTYAETGTWDWQDVDLEYTVGSDGEITIEFITALCNPTGTDFTTAYAVYRGNPDPLEYSLFGDVTWGCLPTWVPTDWCWMLMIDFSWSGIPHDHGVSLTLEWASAFNKGNSIPPVGAVCGWPLEGNPPPAFVVNGL